MKKIYPERKFVIKFEDTMRFAIATNDYNPRYFKEIDKRPVMVPPMFGVVYSGGSIADPIRDPELDIELMRLLHWAHDMHFLSEVRIGDTITSRACIREIGQLKNMDFISIRVNCWNQKGDAVLEEEGIFIVRRGVHERKERRELFRLNEMDERQCVIDEIIPVYEEQAKWYAEASGDRNPIHLDRDFARSAGFREPILHGLCTMSFVARVIIDEYLDSEPYRLRRLKVEFSNPVFPGDFLRMLAWRGETLEKGEILHIEVERDGSRIVKNGMAEVLQATI